MRILLVDEDHSIDSGVTQSLSQLGKNTVVTAKNGMEALAAVEKQSFDVVILGVVIPRLNGFEVCEKLKANARTRDIPVIFLTARTQHHDVHRGMSLGAMGYILKPFDAKNLHSEIEGILRKNAAA